LPSKRLTLPVFQFLNGPEFGQNLQVPIDRAEADPGQLPAHRFIDLVGGHVPFQVPLHRGQDHLSLLRHSIFADRFHTFSSYQLSFLMTVAPFSVNPKPVPAAILGESSAN